MKVKAYVIRNRDHYYALMATLEKEGYHWMTGHKPTSVPYSDDYEVIITQGKGLAWGDKKGLNRLLKDFGPVWVEVVEDDKGYKAEEEKIDEKRSGLL